MAEVHERPTGAAPLKLGKYELNERLGQGGMAEVYKARLATVAGFEKICVVKRILPHLAERTDFLRMFVNEAKLAAQIQHQNVVQVHELGQEPTGEFYMVMELVDGFDLRALIANALEEHIRIPTWFSIHVVCEALSGLAFAHDLTDDRDRPLAIVHRDVTPQNIFVSKHGEVKLADFGIAKAQGIVSETEAGQVKGSVNYMAPEVLLGEKVDRRADVFSAAAVLYECLTKRKAFAGSSNYLTAQMICNAERPLASRYNPEVPPELDEILMRAMAIDPADRIPTAGQFQSELLSLLGTLRPHRLPPEIRFVVDVLRGVKPPTESMSRATCDIEPIGPVTVLPEITRPLPTPAFDPPWGDTGELRVVNRATPAFVVETDEGPVPVSDCVELIRSWPKRKNRRVSVDGRGWIDASRFLELTGLDALWEDTQPLTQVSHVGNLEQTSLIDVFCSLARNRATGRLVLVDTSATRVSRRWIDVIDGAPVYVHTNHTKLQLPDLLIKHQLIAATDLESLLREVVATDRRIEVLAGEHKSRSLHDFWPVVMGARLRELFSWRVGRFAFDTHPAAPRSSDPFAPSLFAFALPAAESYAYPELTRWAQGIRDVHLVCRRPIDDVVVRYGLGPAQRQILEDVEDGQTITALIRSDPTNTEPLLTLLFALAQASEIGPRVN